MRIIVLFDLPVKKHKHRKIYSRFRKRLINDGFYMIQFSVYQKICSGPDTAKKYIDRIESYAPKKGAVRAILLTEKQYSDMRIITGDKTEQEKKLACKECTIF